MTGFRTVRSALSARIKFAAPVVGADCPRDGGSRHVVRRLKRVDYPHYGGSLATPLPPWWVSFLYIYHREGGEGRLRRRSWHDEIRDHGRGLCWLLWVAFGAWTFCSTIRGCGRVCGLGAPEENRGVRTTSAEQVPIVFSARILGTMMLGACRAQVSR